MSTEIKTISPAEIIYRDDFLALVHKPAGITVHRTAGVPDDVVPLLQQVRDLLGLYVYPLHRLDRPTSGIVAFGLQESVVLPMQQQWNSGEVKKTYHALVRGWMPQTHGETSEDLEDSRGIKRKACTLWTVLDQTEIPRSVSIYPQARYSFLQLQPLSGRWHQLRLHLSHLHHPILGDTRHGDRHHNHFLLESLGLWRLMLAAVQLEFIHPISKERHCIKDLPQRGLDFYWKQISELK